MFLRPTFAALIAGAVLLSGCQRRVFDPRTIQPSDRLFAASLREFQNKRWANAVRGFERLTTELPARDPRLPSAYFYLARAQQELGEHLTAAQTFRRISDGFPDDTLADDALFQAGRSYQKLWRKPALDAEHGHAALNVYRTLLVLYPNSPLRTQTDQQIARIEQWLATKDYDTGYHYMKRGAYDSAIIYFRDVIRMYPTAPKTREAYLRLLQSYQAIRYREDARELCATMRDRYPSDREIVGACARVG
jgi:outer membrane assembly lipoprotein YfiO